MNTQKPTLVHVIAWTTLASGIVNLFWGFAASGTALATVDRHFLHPLDASCRPSSVSSSSSMRQNCSATRRNRSSPPRISPIFEIACLLAGNVFSMAVGILSLVFYNDTVVKDYFARLNNGTLEPAPVTAVRPPQSLSLSPSNSVPREACPGHGRSALPCGGTVRSARRRDSCQTQPDSAQNREEITFKRHPSSS